MNVAILGGGVAGLAAAHRLAAVGASVTLFEKASRWGGQLRTDLSDGFVIDHGAEGYAAGRSAVRDLCAAVDITGRLVSQTSLDSLVLQAGGFTAVSASQAARLAGIQADGADFGQGITSLTRGMGELVDALVAALTTRTTLRADSLVTRLAPERDGWIVTLQGGERARADAVVLAIFPHAGAPLVRPWCPGAADLLAAFPAVSTVTVSLACRRDAVAHPLDASGFVVEGRQPDAEGLRACVFVSSKFPGRAPEGSVLLRAFFRPGPALPIDAPDPAWVDRAVQALWPALGVSQAPLRTWVSRWPDALPRFPAGHEAGVADCAARLRSAGAIELAGAGYWRGGVAAAIESGCAAAGRILERNS